MIRIFVALVLALATWNAPAETPTKKGPTEVKVVSLPTPAQPTEVKVVSLPAPPPPQVNVTVPKDDSTRRLVNATWGLLVANVLLCGVTVWFGLKQGWDTRRRDRDTMLREVGRAAHKVLADATRVEQLARQVPTTRTQMHVLMHQGGLPPEIKAETDATPMTRASSLRVMVEDTMPLVPVLPNTDSPLAALSDKALANHLWRLDARQVSIDTMRDSISEELDRYQTEIATLRDQRTTLQAASLTGKLSQPLKTKLGE